MRHWSTCVLVRLVALAAPLGVLAQVYGEDRDTGAAGLAQPHGRSLAVNINRLFRY